MNTQSRMRMTPKAFKRFFFGLLAVLSMGVLLAVAAPARASLIADYQFNSGNPTADSTGITGSLTLTTNGTTGDGHSFQTGGPTGGYLSLAGLSSNGTVYNVLETPSIGFTSSADAWAVSIDVQDPGGAGGPDTGASSIMAALPKGSTSWQLDDNAAITGTQGPSSLKEASANVFGNLADGAWHTILLTHTAGATKVSVYFDGNNVTSAANWSSGRTNLGQLIFSNRGQSSQASVNIDNLKVYNTTAVPEPASLALMGLGGLLLLVRRRRSVAC